MPFTRQTNQAISINKKMKGLYMYNELKSINSRPEPFQFFTTDKLWTDNHTSKKMLEFHLNDSVDAASRNTVFINRSVDWIVSHFRVGDNTRIADFGCGPGLYTTRLAEKGAAVTGIDFSERSINYARQTAAQKGLNINYVLQNYLEYATVKRFDLIIMIMCDFCALSPAQRKQILMKFFTLLRPQGSILLDVYSLPAFKKRSESATYEPNLLGGFWSPADYFGFLNIFKYAEDKVILDKYSIFEESRTRTIYNWLQYFSPDSIKAEFGENGFRINEFYSDVAGTPFSTDSAEFAVVAQKTG
jgi:2-polyprenyl-3-methyl-5-hydroxy-6-metoxy-1,4-benzoquinol methylase